MRHRDQTPVFPQKRRWGSLWLRFLLIGLSLVCIPQESYAVLGSDWNVRTPGGNIVHGGDRCDRYGGVCLTDFESRTVYVSHIRRWRYYTDDAGAAYVIGEREQGWFIFHEASQQTQYFSDNARWQEAQKALAFGKPETKWITPKDEAWRDYGRWFVLICLGYIAGIGVALSAVFWLGWFAFHKIVTHIKNRH
jgi:hypothetical protein